MARPKYIQAAKFKLSGSGVTSSDTTIILTSFKLPDGVTNIVTADLGDTATYPVYMTIEPGTSKEELISFTTVTQNVGGTATLTGVVRGLRFVNPHDEVSANKQSHAGGAIIILTNASALYQRIIDYIDGIAIAGSTDASTTIKGVVEEATDAEVTAGTGAGATGAPLFITPTKLATRLDAVLAPGIPMKAVSHNTIFETSSRFTAILNSGTNTYSTSGLQMETSASATRAAGATWDICDDTAGNVFLGSPVFTASLSIRNVSTAGSSFFGIGLVSKDGAGHNYTSDHCGFKITVSGGVASLYGTQGDGSTETATTALTTVVSTNQIDIMVKMNGSASADYYWQKNGGGWSAATNITTNMPNTAAKSLQFSVSNNSTAVQFAVYATSASYSR